MKIYIAAAFTQKELVKTLALHLQIAGYELGASWILSDNSYEPENLNRAMRDVKEVKNCDIFIYVADGDSSSGGGCHTELGMAIAWMKPIYIYRTKKRDEKSKNVFLRLNCCQDVLGGFTHTTVGPSTFISEFLKHERIRLSKQDQTTN